MGWEKHKVELDLTMEGRKSSSTLGGWTEERLQGIFGMTPKTISLSAYEAVLTQQ